jgi:serine/threonine kinase 32
LERDRSQRIGAISFESFSDNPFFRPVDFVALENREIEPIFKPSSEKTNFDATYDLEELLLEEAPLEARARRQKPREQLKTDATKAEIRAEELHRMIEKLFEPFDYTLMQFDQTRTSDSGALPESSQLNTTPKPGSSRSPYGPEFGQPSSPEQQLRPYPSAGTPGGSPRQPYPDEMPPLPLQGARFGVPPPRSAPEYSEGLRESRSEYRSGKRRPGKSSKRNPIDQLSEDTSGTDHEAPIPPMPAIIGPTISEENSQLQRPSGMLGFLSRSKKGREKSPGMGGHGQKEKERGVLGKAGARAVVNM